MNIYEFTENGVTYVVRGPAGSTVDQARRIFEQQSRTGSLVGLEREQQLNSITQAAQGLPAALAQINSNTLMSAAKTSTIQTKLNEVPLQNPIEVSNFVKQGATTAKIGNLDSSVVQGLLSQTAKTVGQTANQISNGGGVGKYGFNAEQLEKQGYLKPGTAALVKSSGNLVSNLSSPSVWSGQLGVNNVTTLLNNDKIQTNIQTELMSTAYLDLQKNGQLQNLVSDKEIAAVVNTAAKFGNASAVDLIKGNLSGVTAPIIASFAKSSEFSASFGKISGALGNPTGILSGLTGDVSKSIGQLTSNLTAGSFSGLNNLVGGIGNRITGQLSGLTSGLTGQLSGALGGLGGALGGLGGALGGLGGLGGALGGLGGLGGGNPLQSGTRQAKAVINTTNRKTIDASFKNIVDNNKIPLPDYGV